MSFAKIIKGERSKYGLSRKYFGKKVGVAQSTLSDWENGKRLPTWHSVMKVSGRLGWPYDQTLDLIFELENIEEVTVFKKMVWQATLRAGRLGYKDEALAGLIGITTRTLFEWRSPHAERIREVNKKYIERLEEIIAQTDDELGRSLEKWGDRIEDDEPVEPTEPVKRKRSPEEVERQRKQRVELMRRMDEKTDVPGKPFGRWHLLPDDDEDLLALRELMGGK